MTDTRIDLDARLGELAPEAWIDRLDEVAEEHGSFESLGPGHYAAFIDAGKSLLVSFESLQQIQRAGDAQEPRGFDFVRRLGWSSLSIVSEKESWFRGPGLYRYFDRLVDDGFFEDFDRVLFCGAHAGGYAACAYAVAAPGARVLAIRPQATLDPAVTGWDPRYARQRRLNFTDRYGYAPDMIDGVAQAWIVFDPAEQLDAMHAALFTKPYVTMLRARRIGPRLDQALDQMGVTPALIEAAMAGTLSRLDFARAMRARHGYLPYLRGLLSLLDAEERDLFSAMLCRQVLRERDRKLFATRLKELQEKGIIAAPEPTPTA